MNDFIEHCDEDKFANGQSCRDLRVSAIPSSPPNAAPRESIEVRALVFWPPETA